MESIVKGSLMAAGSLLLAIVSQIGSLAFCGVIFWAGNLIIGTLQAKETSECFSGRKFLKSWELLLIFLGILASLALFGLIVGLGTDSILLASKTLLASFCYFMAVNINKNLILLFPKEKFFKRLDYLLKIEFILKLPFTTYSKEKKEGF